MLLYRVVCLSVVASLTAALPIGDKPADETAIFHVYGRGFEAAEILDLGPEFHEEVKHYFVHGTEHSVDLNEKKKEEDQENQTEVVVTGQQAAEGVNRGTLENDDVTAISDVTSSGSSDTEITASDTN